MLTVEEIHARVRCLPSVSDSTYERTYTADGLRINEYPDVFITPISVRQKTESLDPGVYIVVSASPETFQQDNLLRKTITHKLENQFLQGEQQQLEGFLSPWEIVDTQRTIISGGKQATLLEIRPRSFMTGNERRDAYN